MSNPARPLDLAHLPTPLEPAPALSRRLGAEILIKRDDCTGLATGGNKARKLSWLMADALRQGADTVATFGGVQSNHARITAAAAARCGLRCSLLLGGVEPRHPEGNLLLDHLLGAEVEFLGLTPSTLSGEEVERAFRKTEARLRARGRRPYRIPAGGSGPLGVAACASAFDELLRQGKRMGREVETIVVAVGTGGTFAGFVLGNLLAGRPVRIVGISSAPPGMPAAVGVPPVEDLIHGGAEALNRAPEKPTSSDTAIDYSFAGQAYGSTTPECVEAIRNAARDEGILLDPVYTGKAMAGLMEMTRRRDIGTEGAIVFWHTGGMPALFPYGETLLSEPENSEA
jgi:D-cysteine desulfhydrase/L-cysteate sulfo-lyase